MKNDDRTLEEIGKELGRSPSTICRWFKKPSLWNPGLVGDVD